MEVNLLDSQNKRKKLQTEREKFNVITEIELT